MNGLPRAITTTCCTPKSASARHLSANQSADAPDSSAVVTVSMKVSLVDHNGHTFFENQNYTFRQQYQVSREVTSFFEEETPALQRMSQDFARTLVGDIMEAF